MQIAVTYHSLRVFILSLLLFIYHPEFTHNFTAPFFDESRSIWQSCHLMQIPLAFLAETFHCDFYHAQP